MSQNKVDKDYTANAIQQLEGVEHVRQRPAMYIGDVGEPGLHHLINEVVDNSVDEALAGHCTEIEVTLGDDGTVTVLDNGRGIPVGIHEKTGRPAVEMVLTELNTGGKFDKDAYKVSGGLHGVGVSCVNALSSFLEVQVYRDGKIHQQRYERAKPSYDLKVVGKTDRRGTRITFLPDHEIFKQTRTFKFAIVSRRLRELAFLNPGLKIVLRKLGEEPIEEIYHYNDGLVAFVRYLNGADDLLLKDTIYIKGSAESEESGGMVEVEIAIQYNAGYSEVFRSYVNDINTHDGGTHVTGFKSAFTSAFNTFIQRRNEGTGAAAKKKKSRKSKSSKMPSGDSYREGLVSVLSVKVPEPQFAGQNKTKLGNPDVKGLVQQIVGDALNTWIEENPSPAQDIVNKAIEAQRVRDAVRKARDLARKTGKSMKTPKKLADCNSKKPEESEIFLVEGDSAGGSARQGRDAQTQAILPLRGKILNVWKATADKMLGHEEIQAIVTALGTGILEDFDADACRYHKLVIMCDADVDGSHIRTLLLTFLFRQMPELIQRGYVYLACPPLYGVKKKGSRAAMRYVVDESAFLREMHQLGVEGTKLFVEGTDRVVTGPEIIELKRVCEGLLDIDRSLSRRGLTLEEYLGHRGDDGEFMFSRLTTEIGGITSTLYTFSEEEHQQFIEQLRETKRGELQIWEDTQSFLDRISSDLQVSRFGSTASTLSGLLKRLQDAGFSMDQFLGGGAGKVTDEKLLDEDFDIVRAQAELAPFRITGDEGKHELELDALRELPQALLDLGKTGISVKRFKGLGEMNAEELWDTTMDPKFRKLKKITLEDVAEAQRSFSMLMGSKVDGRRHFIETRAKDFDVADLDI